MLQTNFDIIIIGSGISGLNFALRAAEKNKYILVITKKRVAHSSTNFAQGGIAAVLSKLDNYKKHVKDTLAAGSLHNNKKAVVYMVKHGPAAIARLASLGVPFAAHQGKILLAREGGHTERRIAFVSDYTGQAIEKILVERVRENPHIVLAEHTFATDLLIKNKTCYGVQIIRDNGIQNIFGKLVVLATGGAGELYSKTTNPNISTGDGLAMAARVGCAFRDLEFVQFHPTAFAPRGKPLFLISEAVRGEGAYLRNSQGKRFMQTYHKLAELAPRDIVSRAIFEQEKCGRVYLDLRHKKEAYIKTRFPKIYQKLKKCGFNMARDLIPITPAAHYVCGGIKVNLRGETNIKNLYAFGEVAGTGVHGANRLASNSLLEALVFSDRILDAKILTRHDAKKTPGFKKPRLVKLLKKTKNKLCSMRKILKRAMWENVGIIRSKASLETARKTLKELAQKAEKIKGAHPEIMELKNMILAAELITQAALKRKESLGCHYVEKF